MVDTLVAHIQVCIPFRLLKYEYMPMVIDRRINPEIGIDGSALDDFSEKDFSDIASRIHREGLSITLHAPFFDLAPGAMDRLVLNATRKRLRQMFNVVPLFNPKSIVCHTGYDDKRYRSDKETWLDTSLETWTPLAESLRGTATILTLENVYEKTPYILFELLKRLPASNVGFCFDTGHMYTFSDTDMDGWLQAMGPYLKQLHIHDNDGTWDHHWAIGAGEIDFEALFRFVGGQPTVPIITLEAHQEDWLWASLKTLSESPSFIRILSKSSENTQSGY